MTGVSSISTVWEVRHGKLDYETNEIVSQPAQKEGTCWIYALTFLRNQEEVAHPPSETEKQTRRKFQMFASLSKEQLTKAAKTYVSAMFLVWRLKNDSDYTSSRLWTKQGAQDVLPLFSALINNCTDVQTRTKNERTWKLLNSFTQQNDCDDLEVFVLRRYHSTQLASHEQFLKNLQKNPFQPSSSLSVISEEEFKELDLEQKIAYLDIQAFQASVERLEYLESTWHPEHPVNSLIDAIENQGPLYVQGYFGRPAYESEPFKLKTTLLGQPVYGWKPNAAKKPMKTYHSVVSIGVVKNPENPQKSLVYFVDPIDGSDPQNPSQQQIYAMSYQKLIEKIANLSNVFYPMKEGKKEGDPHKSGYALYNPALVKKKEALESKT